ncbi:hypothetical protein [Pseudorhodoferax sp.]|uniref:hypothetical protein n=1 Tax=Pseudorhodoferax sp. TaxID=1993553 RepID=UPI002DD65163|nr:hypothetical protein [Pseudorhodoferax sp.]
MAPIRWLLVHELHDSGARWLAAQWCQRLGPHAAELLLLPAPALALCSRWQVRVQSGGTHSRLQVTLGDGATARHHDIDSAQLLGVLHRSCGPWVAAAAADHDYVVQERHALLLTWLHGLGARCLNAPRADALDGPAWSAAQWRWEAQRCGMPVAPWPDPAGTPPPLLRMLVAGQRSFAVNGPALDGAWHQAARRLAATAGCGLLGLYLAPWGAGTWRFAQASVQADPRAGGSAAADALADAMAMPPARQPVEVAA